MKYLTILINPTKMKMKTKAMTFGKCLWKVIRCPEVWTVYTKYKYREYVAGNQKVYEITETTKVEIVVNGDNNKFYTHPKMPDGEYYIRVWLDNINLGKMSGVDYSSINDTLKGVILDNILRSILGVYNETKD